MHSVRRQRPTGETTLASPKEPQPDMYEDIEVHLTLLNVLNQGESSLNQEICDLNVEALKSECALKRDEAAQRLSEPGPPLQFRLIDCKSTCDRKRVVLVDWLQDEQYRYSAISHTWGEDAYAVFNCECACDCSGCNIPRYDSCTKPCSGMEAHDPLHREVIGGILNMCERLMGAGCEFLWHDGVCIAQHNGEEVTDTIGHMGWVYANASDTIIFLHNVGNPMSLLPLHEPYKTRWNRRVWTLQEAALSRRRRYCIRLVHFCKPPDDFFMGLYRSAEEYSQEKLAYISESHGHSRAMSSTLRKDFETKLEQCYQDDSCIAVIEEERFWSHLLSLWAQVQYLCKRMLVFPSETASLIDFRERESKWLSSLKAWIMILTTEFFQFPDLFAVIIVCSKYRESKHEGDRINSLLGLARITDFVAPKDGEFEASTIQFLKRVGQQEQQGLLQHLLFSVNECHVPEEVKRHTWLPYISRPITCSTNCSGEETGQNVVVLVETGMVQLRGPMWCIAVQFTLTSKPVADLTRLCENFDEYEQLYRDCSILTMDLLDDWPRNSPIGPGLMVLASGSDKQLGRVLCPVRDVNSQVANPVLFHGRELREGGSISAHLVFGDFGRHKYNAIIVKGTSENLAAHYPVSKLGVYETPSHMLSFIFQEKPFPFTILTELLID